MRKIVAFTLMGIDGAVEDPSLLFPPSDLPDEPFSFDEESEAFEAEVIATQDAILLGRNQWEEWQRFWPGASGPFADFINGVDKYVLTSRPLDAEWAGSVPVQGSLPDVIEELRAKPGSDVGVHGSIQLVQSLIEADLLDELRLIATPVVGAPGRRLFDNLKAPQRYRLVSAAASSTGNLLLTYDRPGSPSPVES
ncbi:dihydrofolate reductase family protein [Knoellia locipacati]|uniref:Pyrimidine reductase n=1 Tax=Knoellia locipacati TaxID=882824 RepID=A0A512SZ90_9MICO|nr:dihydrofolate reductase family protein [Knoellia locipacati]GEQ13250.1 pyrimidine reductase [Knoellia locipacati]